MIIDILRATSTICTALSHGVEKVIPVSELDECRSFEGEQFLLAAERNGLKPDGFSFGNSPYDYMGENVAGKTLVLTTSNGTRAANMASKAAQVLIGSFLNLDTVADYLAKQSNDCLLFCAGWKGGFSMEDTLFAGALVEMLNETYEVEDDAALAAMWLYQSKKEALFEAMRSSSHFNRLAGHGIEKDIKFCLTLNEFNILPVLKGKEIVTI